MWYQEVEIEELSLKSTMQQCGRNPKKQRDNTAA